MDEQMNRHILKNLNITLYLLTEGRKSMKNILAKFITRSSYFLILALIIVEFIFSGCSNETSKKPNILIIMADDMGFSDLSCYGSEISTPNIDRLANEGMRFTNIYNSARCCPTRASVLTGLYPHQTGMGGMITRKKNGPTGSYQGYINNNCVTIAEVLKFQGYQTYMSGKWHVGEFEPQ
jgi:Sulfatase